MKEKKKLSINTKLILFLVISTLIMSVGYAILTGTSLSISGGASIANDGVVSITSVTNHASSNVTENTAAAIVNDGQGISFDLNVTVTQNNYNQDFYITYRITVNNDSISNQKVLATNFTPVFTGSGVPPTATFDITDGNGNSMLNDTIPAKTTNTYYLTITMHPTETGSWGVGGETTVETGDTDTGTVIGSLSGTTQGDLTGNNNLVHFTVDVINSHDTSKTFTLSITDAKFEIVNQNGNALSSMTINANSTSTYDFYIKKASGAKFMVSQQDLNIYLNCDGNTQSTGVVNLTVDVDPTLTDFNAPVISDVTATQLSTDKQVRISWNYSEENTVTNFFIEIYVVDEMTGRPDLRDTVTVPGSQTSSIVTLQFGSSNYLFKVYGIDQSTNTASSDEISTCNTNAGHCSRNNSRRYSWSIIVDLTLNYATANSGSITTSGNTNYVRFTVGYDSNLTVTLSGYGTDRAAPESISSATINYPETPNVDSTLSSGNSSQTAYSYNSSSGVLNLYHIVGDIKITATGKDTSGCLIEGTKILLADGTSKNIEDIEYDDLLAVWSYDTGSLTYEYPLWIEKAHTGFTITKVILEDDSYIEFVNQHSVYNTDLNLFVNIYDTENFHIGSHIAKLNDNNELVSMTVKDIQVYTKDVNYYFVGSTRYYNIFANRILTTDRSPMISNLYGFEDNAKWPAIKEKIVNNPNNIVSYEGFGGHLPYYLYKGFRAGEVGYLINQNIVSLPEFIGYILLYITNDTVVKPPINYNGSNYWMVTTSLDSVVNKKDFLREEGSTYTLPYVDGVNEWYNTADNKIYHSGDEVEVVHGMHFIAR